MKLRDTMPAKEGVDMAITSKAGILKVLTSFNPWRKTGTVNPQMAKTYRRLAFHEAMKRLAQTDLRRTVILTGTRRVGKTTIQHQMIQQYCLERSLQNRCMASQLSKHTITA